MSYERQTTRESIRKSSRIVARSLCVLALVGCTRPIEAATPPPDPIVSSSIAVTETAGTPEKVISIAGTLNYDGLRSDNLCQGGGTRPCFAPIRTEPHFPDKGTYAAADMSNAVKYYGADGIQTVISWPFEANPADPKGMPGDPVTVVCRVQGDLVHGYDTDQASSVWDAIIVPAAESVTNRQEVGYTPERWVRLPPGLVIPICDVASNPAGAPLIMTPTS